MRVCCLIDSLGPGGAQRQMVMLVRLLAERGHDVSLVTFHSIDHYGPLVRRVGVEPTVVSAATKVGRCFAVRNAVRRLHPQVIVAFLNTPGILGVLSSLPPRRIPVIVSERSWSAGGMDKWASVRFNFYRMTDRIVTNSRSQAKFISETFPFLSSKTSTIVNCVDTDTFRPGQRLASETTRIIVVGSVTELKNTHRFIEAIQLVNGSDDGVHISVDWYGNSLVSDGLQKRRSDYFVNAMKRVCAANLEGSFRFIEPTVDIHSRYPEYDACCLPSLVEGCPNAVCEAMACGLPVLVSDVGDNRCLVSSSDHGLRFNPQDPHDIADKLLTFAKLDPSARSKMGAANRSFAIREFATEAFVEKYEKLFEEVLA